LLCWVGVHCGIYKSSAGVFFHLHTCVHSIFTILTLLHPIPTSSPFYWYQHPSGRTCSTLLFSDFVKENQKKWYFCLCNIATQGISLWQFHVYMFYSQVWFISSIFLLSTLVPFLWLSQQNEKFYIHSYIDITSTIFNFFLLPSASHVWSPFSMSSFS
jgi:hypothetical protein